MKTSVFLEVKSLFVELIKLAQKISVDPPLKPLKDNKTNQDSNNLICGYVDDDEDIVRSVEILFRIEGILMKKGYSGLDAINMVENEQIHMLFIDNHMPFMSGDDAIKKIRSFEDKTKALIPICRISGITVEETTNPEVDLILHKPTTTMQLKEAVKSLTKLRQDREI